jgi:hypothetical protein
MPEIAADRRSVQSLHRHGGVVQPAAELAEVTTVGVQRSRAEVPLERQMSEIVGDMVVDGGGHGNSLPPTLPGEEGKEGEEGQESLHHFTTSPPHHFFGSRTPDPESRIPDPEFPHSTFHIPHSPRVSRQIAAGTVLLRERSSAPGNVEVGDPYTRR